MQTTQQSNKIVFTKDQSLEIEKFGKDLGAENVEFAFEGSLLEGKAYLEGIVNIVQTINP